jgi:predicted anti-sigma-YlaC factor YlaD
MNCSEIQKLLSTRFDDELCEELNIVLAPHLEKCSECRNFQEDLVRCVTALNCLSSPSARPGFTSRVMSQLPDQTVQLAWRAQLLPVSPIRIGFGSLGLACGIALAILMVSTQEMNNTSGSENLSRDGIDYSEVFAATPMNSIGGRYMAFANHEEE